MARRSLVIYRIVLKQHQEEQATRRSVRTSAASKSSAKRLVGARSAVVNN